MGGYGPGISGAVAWRSSARRLLGCAIVARNAERLDAGVKKLQAKGIKAAAFPADLGDSEAVRGMVAKVRAALGPITVLQWTAYATDAGNLLTADTAALHRTFDVAVFRVACRSAAALPDLKKGDGRRDPRHERGLRILRSTDGRLRRSVEFDGPLHRKFREAQDGRAPRAGAEGRQYLRRRGHGARHGEGYRVGFGRPKHRPSDTVANKFWELYTARTEVRAPRGRLKTRACRSRKRLGAPTHLGGVAPSWARETERGIGEMKFMLMMNALRGTGDWNIMNWSKDDYPGRATINSHEEFSTRELREAGELVGAEGLTAPGQARVVRAGKGGAPEVTDGPFAESKEFLAGFWMIDVESPERAYALAARAPRCAGAGRGSTEHGHRSARGVDERASSVTGVSVAVTAEHLLRELTPQVLGVVARRFGDFAAAEDAVQEALTVAALKWPDDGVPDNPRAWLIQVATRRMTDHVRADLARRRREAALVMETAPDERMVSAPDTEDAGEQDDTLVMLFMCCHPALTRPSAIALTLRAVGGLTTAEIASAFLVPEATMAQRDRVARSRPSRSQACAFACRPKPSVGSYG